MSCAKKMHVLINGNLDAWIQGRACLTIFDSIQNSSRDLLLNGQQPQPLVQHQLHMALLEDCKQCHLNRANTSVPGQPCTRLPRHSDSDHSSGSNANSTWFPHHAIHSSPGSHATASSWLPSHVQVSKFVWIQLGSHAILTPGSSTSPSALLQFNCHYNPLSSGSAACAGSGHRVAMPCGPARGERVQSASTTAA